MKLFSLSNFLAVFIFLFSYSQSFSQSGFWNGPVSLTDSVTNNINPVVMQLNMQNAEYNFYVFWEKSEDTQSTAIYYKNFYEENEPHVFIENENVHYKCPQPLNMYNNDSDTLFYVFYISDEQGSDNIYYRLYDQNDFSEPAALTETSGNKSDLICYLNGSIFWLEQDKVMFVKMNFSPFYFEDPIVVDSGNCSSPTTYQLDFLDAEYLNPVAAWIKQENDSSKIILGTYSDQSKSFTKQVIFTASQCRNLSFSTGYDFMKILTWDYFDGNSWRICFYDMDNDDIYISDFDRYIPFQPRYYSGYFLVRDLMAGMTTFIYEAQDHVGVYTSEFGEGIWAPLDNYDNVSGATDSVNKPRLFTGKMGSCGWGVEFHFINMWEELVNDHWQIKYDTAYICTSGVKENEQNTICKNLSVTPNPCMDKTVISFLLEQASEIKITVSNMSGKQMSTIVSGKLDAGQHEFVWNGDLYTPGVYLVRLQSGATVISKKLILSK